VHKCATELLFCAHEDGIPQSGLGTT